MPFPAVTNRNQINPLPFYVTPVHPSGVPQINDGKVTAQRSFHLKWKDVNEFMLRVFGKYYQEDDVVSANGVTIPAMEYPVFPAPYPMDSASIDRGLRYSLFAQSASVDMNRSATCQFSVSSEGESSEEFEEQIINLESPLDLEKYYFFDLSSGLEDAMATVTVTYAEAEWDCASSEILPNLLLNTGIRSEIQPSYEVYTMPSRNLFFPDVENEDKTLKDDTKAYTIIPKFDITVHWSNVPVRLLCQIYDHLKDFRGKVNDTTWGHLLYCEASDDESVPCNFFPAETVLFLDYEEDLSRRTYGFNGFPVDMNTTTLKLHFKVKHISLTIDTGYGEPEVQEYGWNHLPTDHTKDAEIDPWSRVKVKVGDSSRDLFERIDFTDILNPPVYQDPT